MKYQSVPARPSAGFALGLVTLLLAAATALAQQTPGGAVITNSATVTYTEPTGSTVSTSTNSVSFTVANVSGLAITPDGGAAPTVVPGQTGVVFNFTVTNTGNFTDRVRFLAGGASVRATGPATVTRAVIDADSSNTITAGDTDILTNAADVVSAGVAQNATLRVLVEASVTAGAAAGSTVTITLGDAGGASPFDNQAADSSANEVRTVAGGSANGLREARGDFTATVVSDALLRLTLTAPAGPVAPGGDIAYTWQLANTGSRSASAQALGPNTGVYIVAPVPVGTALKTGQSFPAGTLYTTDPVTTAPLAAVWSATPPGALGAVTRVAFNVGSSLAAGASSSAVTMTVTVRADVNASVPIRQIGDAFGRTGLGSAITDQSGDAVSNGGDGNASFDEDALPGNAAPQFNGVPQSTSLLLSGAVLLGPSGSPAAVGPTGNNDDYTNKTVTGGTAGVAPGGVTTAASTVVFTNTVQNTGNGDDTFTFTAPTVPAGFTVELSTNGGASYTALGGGGSATLAVPFGATANVLVRVTAPAGRTVLTGYGAVIRATSANTPAASNDTIDRLFTGFVRADKAVTVINSTGVGGPSDPVPGAVVEYAITYSNVSTATGAGNADLAATGVTIVEDGNAAPNTWGANTTQVVGSASDTRGGVISGDAAGSTSLTDAVPGSLGPGQSGVFRFRRTIK
jgi:hypothetical protein